MAPKTMTVGVKVLDLPEMQEWISNTTALVEAVRGLPHRWSDGCGECSWCRLDAALAAFDQGPHT